MRKILMLLCLSVLSGCYSAVLYPFDHEDGHYGEASKYGLNPKLSYVELRVGNDPAPTDDIELDVLGGGVTGEQLRKKELADYRVPNNPITLRSLYRFTRSSHDGRRYLAKMPDEAASMERVVKLEPLIYISQLLFNYYDSPLFITSFTEVDRRGVYTLYELTLKFSF